MTARGVPIIHLLHIKGLAVKFNLPWDPVPLPEPGAWQPADEASANGHWFWMLSIGYFGLLLLLAAGKRPFSSSRYLRAPR